MKALRDLSGLSFQYLTVIELGARTSPGKTYWSCRCVCGVVKDVAARDLIRGASSSCGCMRRALVGASIRKHGFSKLVEYRIWKGIKTRCYNTKCVAYPDYGGRGIVMCDSWRDDAAQFLADMGSRLTPAHSIDRLDSDGHYSPGNCRWATPVEQAHNRRNSVFIEVEGEQVPLAKVAALNSINKSTLRSRLERGESLSVALRSDASTEKRR